MDVKIKSYFTKWGQKKSWSPLPTHEGDDTDSEKKLLDGDNIAEQISRSTLEDSREVIWSPKLSTWRSHRKLLILLFINTVIFCVSLIINRSALWDENYYVRKTSYYSPIIEKIPIRFHDTRLNGSVWPESSMGWTRLEKGNPIAEEMWQSFEDIHVFPITRKEVIKLGKDPDYVAKFEEDYWGMGDDAYMATTDATHKIHCLNELRKTAFMTYGDDPPRVHRQHSQLWWLHQRHCLDIIAQDILCHADADLFTFNWMDTQRKPFPDFSINRKCRSMDDIWSYREAHAIDMDKWLRMPRPPHANLVPQEPGYYAMFGFEGSDLFPHGHGYTHPLPELSQWYGNISINGKKLFD